MKYLAKLFRTRKARNRFNMILLWAFPFALLTLCEGGNIKLPLAISVLIAVLCGIGWISFHLAMWAERGES